MSTLKPATRSLAMERERSDLNSLATQYATLAEQAEIEGDMTTAIHARKQAVTIRKRAAEIRDA